MGGTTPTLDGAQERFLPAGREPAAPEDSGPGPSQWHVQLTALTSTAFVQTPSRVAVWACLWLAGWSLVVVLVAVLLAMRSLSVAVCGYQSHSREGR